MLNRRYTEALEELARAKNRIAAAEEKQYAALLQWYFPDQEDHAPQSRDDGTRSDTARKVQDNPTKK